MRELADKGEENWWTGVKPLLTQYGLPENLAEIKNLSKSTFKESVNKKVQKTAFDNLKRECVSLKKTAELSYDAFELQGYLKELYPNQARTVMKTRCKTLDIKTHSTYKYNDTLCRNCEKEEETLEHILNCGQEVPMSLDFARISISDQMFTRLIQAVNRITIFQERCDDKCQKGETEPQPECIASCNC